eukprot:gene4330-21048_t
MTVFPISNIPVILARYRQGALWSAYGAGIMLCPLLQVVLVCGALATKRLPMWAIEVVLAGITIG